MKDFFRHKVVWITGASSGIGREMAIQLSALGAHCILSARNEEALAETASLLYPGTAYLLLPLDMQQPSFEAPTQTVIRKFGHIDILMLNAGISQRSAARDTNLSTDRRLMEVNFFGPAQLCKTVLPHMRERNAGIIAYTSSLAGKFGFYQRSAYAASKHAMQGFLETLALEEYGRQIKIRLLCPAGVKTQISQNALAGDGSTYGKSSELQESGSAVEDVVRQMIEALAGDKQEVLIGTAMEKLSLKIKVLFPRLFWKIIRSKKPADITE